MVFLASNPTILRPALSNRNAECVSQRHARRIGRRARQVDSMDFFNLITGPELLEPLEALLPEYRERKYPPTVTLAMFSVKSCVPTVLPERGERVDCQSAFERVGSGQCEHRRVLPGTTTPAYGDDQRPGATTGSLLNKHAAGWLWRGRHVKYDRWHDPILMPDAPENQADFPQHGSQEPGAGFPLARLVGVISLANGAVLDIAMGPYQGKGTGEYGLFRELLGCFVAGDVMLADSYYCSYF